MSRVCRRPRRAATPELARRPSRPYNQCRLSSAAHDPCSPATEAATLILVRAVTYATLFIGFFLVFLPARVLAWVGIGRPGSIGPAQVAGVLIGATGAFLALWCIAAFAAIGRGTPAPFDPPRHLVIRGPYRFVRNPMYIGAGLALAGAALFYGSWSLLGYCAAFLFITHLFVILYEEPALRETFGEPYVQYCQSVGRWWPRRHGWFALGRRHNEQ